MRRVGSVNSSRRYKAERTKESAMMVLRPAVILNVGAVAVVLKL